jgi:transcriptional regulator with XRE-family HTH domain
MYSHPQQRADHDVQKLRQQAGKWLKSLREERGLSQRQLAERVQVDYYTFISQLEAGRGRIPPNRYVTWAEALGVAPDVFVRELMRFYDPVTHAILFGAPTDGPGTVTDVTG